jgi:hypothetical protein
VDLHALYIFICSCSYRTERFHSNEERRKEKEKIKRHIHRHFNTSSPHIVKRKKKKRIHFMPLQIKRRKRPTRKKGINTDAVLLHCMTRKKKRRKETSLHIPSFVRNGEENEK